MRNSVFCGDSHSFDCFQEITVSVGLLSPARMRSIRLTPPNSVESALSLLKDLKSNQHVGLYATSCCSTHPDKILQNDSHELLSAQIEGSYCLHIIPPAPRARPGIGLPSIEEVQADRSRECDHDNVPEVPAVMKPVDKSEEHQPLHDAHRQRLVCSRKCHAQLTLNHSPESVIVLQTRVDTAHTHHSAVNRCATRSSATTVRIRMSAPSQSFRRADTR